MALCPWFAETAIVDPTTKDMVMKKSPLKFVSVKRVGEAFELAAKEQRYFDVWIEVNTVWCDRVSGQEDWLQCYPTPRLSTILISSRRRDSSSIYSPRSGKNWYIYLKSSLPGFANVRMPNLDTSPPGSGYGGNNGNNVLPHSSLLSLCWSMKLNSLTFVTLGGGQKSYF